MYISYFLIALLFPIEALANLDYGNDAVANQFPYQVSLRKRNEHSCGGSIIAESRVLSAAHCVTTSIGRKKNKDDFEILAGVIDRRVTKQTDGAFLTKVKFVYVHRLYNYRNFDYDAAVLITEKKFNLKLPSLAAVPLSSELKISAHTQCTLSGWGKNDKHESPALLKYSFVFIISRSDCRALLSPIIITKQMICAQGNNVADAAPGDSGGPMVCNGKLVGIVSYAKANAAFGTKPGIFTFVAEIETWARTTNSACVVRISYLIYLIWPIVLGYVF